MKDKLQVGRQFTKLLFATERHCNDVIHYHTQYKTRNNTQHSLYFSQHSYLLLRKTSRGHLKICDDLFNKVSRFCLRNSEERSAKPPLAEHGRKRMAEVRRRGSHREEIPPRNSLKVRLKSIAYVVFTIQ